MGTLVRMPPRGRYLASEAGELAGVSGQTMGQWARRGYIRSSHQDDPPRIYSFQDIAEAMVVHELLDRGVPHGDIRRAIATLHEYGEWPLTEAPLGTLAGMGRARVVVDEDGATYDVGLGHWQQVVEPAHLEEIREQLRRGGWAVRNLPDLQHIEVNPERLSGKPTIRGRRIAAADVAEIADARGGEDTLVEDYELSDREIADARRWWGEVRRLVAA
jgi:uncharacterized protein (DUF433 family)